MTPGSSSSTGDSPLSVNTAGCGRILQLSSSAASSAVLDLVVSSSSSARLPVAPVKSRRTPSTAGEGMMMMVLSGSRHLPPGPETNHGRPDSVGTDGGGGGAGSSQRLSSDDGGSANPLKRRNTDATVDYPRRRATIACEVCRSRKSRCDGTRPKCKLCAELGADCVYREPGVKLDAGDKLILERLSRIESLLQMSMAATSHNDHDGSSNSNDMNNHSHSHNNSNSDNSNDNDNNTNNSHIHNAPSSPSISSGTVNGEGLAAAVATLAAAHAAAPSHMAAAAAVIPSGGIGGLGTWASGPAGTNISTMPKVHTNAALHLLRWPGIRDLVALPYDPQILLQLEMAREPLHSLTKTPCVDLTNTEAYCIAYFDRVNVWYACVNPYSWGSHYRIALSNGFREGPESCIVLLVLALGQASLRGSISRIVPHEDPPGLQYFTAAWALLPGMMTSNSVLAAQCHLLAAAYLFYLVRPLEAWNLLCTTSTKLQLLLMSPSARIPAAQRELTERIYWNALLFESDLLAELDLPHSGVVQFEENVGLPGGFEPEVDDDPAQQQGQEQEQQEQQEQEQQRRQQRRQQQQQDQPAVGRDDLWYFLAEIALRRLLNRVSQLIYSKDSVVSAASLEPVVSELDFQLMQWYENLPLPLQFPSTRQPLRDPVQTVLRLRFNACRTIIYRPYILAVLDNEQAALDAVVRESCHRCLESAIRQLEHITSHHCGHMPYLWQGALSIVSQTLLVMGATLSPSLLAILLSIVPHQETLDQIFNSVVVEIGRYAVLAPSLRLAAEIVRDAEVRRRTFLNR